MPPVTDLLGVAILVVLFLSVIALAELWARRGRPGPEWPRKLVHLGGGLGCLLFPFLVKSPWTVLAMGIGFGAALWLGERGGRLTCLSGVKRQSHGSAYYPLAIALLFWLGEGRYWLYLAAVLILTVSDTAAALVGSALGRHRFRVSAEGDVKSLEGCCAFWLLTFLAAWLPLAFMAPVGRGVSFMAALLVATVLAAVEAVSTKGRDNILVPTVCVFVLLKLVSKPFAEIALQNLMLALVGLGVGLLCRRDHRLLRTKEAVLLALFVYAVWTLGSFDWAVPVLFGIVIFCGLRRLHPADLSAPVSTAFVLRHVGPAVALVLYANTSHRFGDMFGPFLAAVTAPFVCSCLLHLELARRHLRQVLGNVVLGAGIGASLALASMLTQAVWGGRNLLLSAAVGALTAWGWESPWIKDLNLARKRNAMLALTCAAVLVCLGIQSLGWADPWSPALWADVFEREL